MHADLIKLINHLKANPQSKANLFAQYTELWRELNFNQAQVSLWLSSLPLQNHQHETNAAYLVTPDIGAHLVALLQHFGGRMPLAQALKKLPAGITTSEQQIRKLAHEHAQLDIKGPLLILVN